MNPPVRHSGSYLHIPRRVEDKEARPLEGNQHHVSVAIVADDELGLPCKKSRYGFAPGPTQSSETGVRRPSRLERPGRVTEGGNAPNSKASLSMITGRFLKHRETASRSPSISKSAALVHGKREPAKNKQPEHEKRGARNGAEDGKLDVDS
ncbi:hypothetical protein BDZ89DRAFT_1072515, partial [Hymenopellis radicata]